MFKKLPALFIGVALIVAALFLAFGTTSQDHAVQPEVAREFATALHITPSATPTNTAPPLPTASPLPTATPLARGTHLQVGNVGLELPESYDSVFILPSEGQPPVDKADIIARQVGVSYVADLEDGLPRGVRNMRLIRVSLSIPPDQVPPVVLGPDLNASNYTSPMRVSLGRYPAFRSIVNGPTLSGIPVKKLLYWTAQGEIYWLVIFTAPAADFDSHLSAFESSASSFTIRSLP